jgi:hypothetical protein
VLWDSGILQTSDGLRETGPLDVTGLVRVILVTEFAHDDRPAGADPLDIRDQVCWLDPLLKLDLAGSGQAERVIAILPGVGDWRLAGDGWRDMRLASRWSPIIASWEPILSLPRETELRLTRQFRVTASADIVELLTACPLDLSGTIFTHRQRRALHAKTTRTAGRCRNGFRRLAATARATRSIRR